MPAGGAAPATHLPRLEGLPLLGGQSSSVLQGSPSSRPEFASQTFAAQSRSFVQGSPSPKSQAAQVQIPSTPGGGGGGGGPGPDPGHKPPPVGQSPLQHSWFFPLQD